MLILLANPLIAHSAPKTLNTNFIKLNDQRGTDLNLFINKEDLEHDLSSGDFDLRIFFDGRSLLRDKEYPQTIKVEVYTIKDGNKNFVSILSRTVKSNKASKNILMITRLPRINESIELFFDIHDSHNILHSTYIQEIELTASQITDIPSFQSVPDYNCINGDGECLIEYLLRHISFSASYDRNLKTEVIKNEKGRYTVSIPVKKGRRLKKKVKKLNVGAGGGKTSNKGNATVKDPYPYFDEGSNEVATSFWDDLRDAIKFSFAGSDKNFSLNKDGSLQLSTNTQDGYLNIAAGTTTKAPIVLNQGNLLTSPIDGAIEYDGNNLYLTKGNSRTILGAQGPVGPAGPSGPPGPSGSGGSGSGIDLSNGGYLNGTINFITGGLIEDAIFNGSLQYRTGANNGLVLTSDANGNATWQPVMVLVNSTVLSTGPIGSVQFAGASNGFDFDYNNFFWDDTNNRLGIGTNTPDESIDTTGNVRSTNTNANFIADTSGAANSPAFLQIRQAGTRRGFMQLIDSSISDSGLHEITLNNEYGPLKFRTGTSGSERDRLTIDHNGDVGIGFTNPQAKLDLNGSIAIRDGTEASNFVLTSDVNGFASWQNPNTLIATGDNLGDHTATQSLDMNGFNISDSPSITATNRITLDEAGNSPDLILEPNGPYYGYSVDATNVTGGWARGYNFTQNGGMIGSFGGYGGPTGLTYLYISTKAGTQQYLDANGTFFRGGNVGIGFRNPLSTLDLNGSIAIRDGTQANNFVLTSNTSGLASWQDPSSILSGSATASGSAGAVQFSDGSNGFNSDAANFFWNNASNRLGIGTANPTESLVVNGNINMIGVSPRIWLNEAKTYAIGYNNSTQIDFIQNSNINLTLRRVSASSASLRAKQFSSALNAAQYPVFTSIDSPDTGVYFHNTKELGFTVNGTSAMHIDSDVNDKKITFGTITASPNADAQVEIINSNGDINAFAIQAASSQTADLTQWQDANGARLLAIDSNGRFHGDGIGNIEFVNFLNENAGIMFEPISADGRIRMKQTIAGSNASVEFWPGGTGVLLPRGHIIVGSIRNAVKWGAGTSTNNNNLRLDTTSATAADATLKLRAERYVDTSANGQPSLEIAAKRINLQISDPDTYLGTYTTIAAITQNGKFAIMDGSQATGYVLTSDTNGQATWTDSASILSGSATASGPLGAIQFSDGSNGFDSDASNFFWNGTTNRLGIGTRNPAVDLEINGATTAFRLAPTNSFGRDFTFSASGSDLRLTANDGGDYKIFNRFGTEVMRYRLGLIVPTHSIEGKVGYNLGITTTPTAALDIKPDSNSESGIRVEALAGQSANITEWLDSSSNDLVVIDNTGTVELKAGLSTDHSLDFNGSNFGIYSSASGIIIAESISNRWMFTTSSFTSMQNTGGRIQNLSNATTPAFNFVGDPDTGIGQAAANEISLITNGNAQVRIDEDGFVGIGTSNPSSRLEVDGDLTVSPGNLLLADAGGNTDGHKIGRLTIDYQSSSNPKLNSDGSIIYFGDDLLLHGAGTIGASLNAAMNLDITHQRPNMGIGFSTNNGSTVATRMFLDNGGNLGIGENSPQRKLHINDVMRLEPRATAPSSPATGDIYIDSTGTEAACVYLNGAWVVMAGSGSCS